MNKSILLILILLSSILSGCTEVEAETAAIPHLPTITIVASPTITKTLFPTITPSPSPTPTELPKGDRRVTLMAVGDVMLGRTIGEMIENEGTAAPFQFVAETLMSADITIGNLECPITSRGEAEPKTYTFRAPTGAGDSLAQAGFDLVSLANNHVLDFGSIGLEDTLKNLSTAGVHSVGAGMNKSQAYAPVFLEIDGLRLAFLAFADIPPADYDYQVWEAGPNKPGIAWAHSVEVREGIIHAKENADVVIVLVHNGYEIVQNVFSAQQEIARVAIDSGASLVIGSHPHVLQRIESYKDGLIAYSMGNFVFDNFLFPPNYSAILSVELSPNGIESFELIDVIVQLNGVPQIMPYNLEN